MKSSFQIKQIVTVQLSLHLQLIWLALAVSYNVSSVYLLQNGFAPLKKGDPEMTLYFLAMYGLLIGLGFAKQYRLYGVFGAALTAVLLIAGVGSHIYTAMTTGIADIYSSGWAWMSAILINCFGVSAFLLGLFIVRTKQKEQ
jgi:hypothetical protein